MLADFTHLDESGAARMVDITAKPPTQRWALARCRVVVGERGVRRLGVEGPGAAVIEEARVAGIMAAKRTSSLIPLCHPVPLGDVALSFTASEAEVVVEAQAETFGATGVEMEALTACAVAALTLAGASLGDEPSPVIDELTLWQKVGGRSGAWRRAEALPG